MIRKQVSQSFLGPGSDERLFDTTVAIIGLGGGGSHINQQLVHLGVGDFILVDHDHVEMRNLNRLVGATETDAKCRIPKVGVATRLIHNVNCSAKIEPHQRTFQEVLDPLRRADVIFGCVDSFSARDELEKFARRFLIPYIDIGMDVTSMAHDQGFNVFGQAVASIPGGPCLRCFGVLRDELLAREAEQYGAAGSRPQVVWVNGTLASTAVGLFAQLVCPWYSGSRLGACCEFDANNNRVETYRSDNSHLLTCSHFAPTDVGDPWFTTRVS